MENGCVSPKADSVSLVERALPTSKEAEESFGNNPEMRERFHYESPAQSGL